MLRRLAVVAGLVLAVAGCQVSESPAPSAPDDLVEARDTALDYVQLRYLVGFAPTMAWEENQAEDTQLADWVDYQYTALPWVVTVGGPVAEPDDSYFDIVVSNPVTGFSWQGRVVSDGAVVEGSEQVLAACDFTCDFVSERFPELQLDKLSWSGLRVSPTDSAGQETYQYSADDWTLTVSYPIVAPDSVSYDVTLENEETGFVWEGEMDPARHLIQVNAFSRLP